MPRSPKVSPQQRKGKVVTSVNLNSSQQATLDRLSAEHNGVSEYREYDNGSVGVFFNDGKFRFVSGSNRLQGRVSGSKVKYPALSPRAAKMAFKKYYQKKKYATPRARKAAITRDMCSANKQVITDSRYRRSPHRYDYKGLDDGSQCPHGNVHAKKVVKADPNFASNMMEAKNAKRVARGQSPVQRRKQAGGSSDKKPVSLKTAVKLLRQYYAEKYSN